MTDYPIYIAVPHQTSPQQWFLTEATQPIADDFDQYIVGDHDLHHIMQVDSRRELTHLIATYNGHQRIAVQALGAEILNS